MPTRSAPLELAEHIPQTSEALEVKASVELTHDATLQHLLERRNPQAALPDAHAVVLGTLVALDAQGHARVWWSGHPPATDSAQPSSLVLSLVALNEAQIGQTVALSV